MAGRSGAEVISELYLSYAPAVLRWASRLGGPKADAEDIVQEVFLIAQRSLHTVRDSDRIRSWLFQVTANELRRRHRRDWLRRFLGDFPADDAESAPDLRATPEESFERREAVELTYRILDSMADKYRTVLVLFQLEGMSGEEISELTGRKLATVWVHLHRARADFLRRHQAMKGAAR